jgi:hypothetical protein
MTDALQPIPFDDDTPAKLTAVEWRMEFQRGQGLSKEGFVIMANALRHLIGMGEDISDLMSIPITATIKKVADGRLAVEAAVVFYAKRSLVEKVATLSLPDQKRLASGAPLPVAFRAKDGSIDQLMVEPKKMSQAELNRVIVNGEILPLEEQLSRDSAATIRAKSRPRKCMYDANRQEIVTPNGERIPIADINEALAAHVSQESAVADLRAAYRKKAKVFA